MLKPQELATVVNRLQVPTVISAVMQGRELLEDVEYALHEALSNMQPDSALLSIAFSAKALAAAYECSSLQLGTLKIECDRVINEYARLWLRHAENQPVREEDAFDALSRVAEDLEDIAELLLTAENLPETGDGSALFRILRIQAAAQAAIAETYFNAIAEIPPSILQEAASVQASGNVIPFPQKRV